MRKMMIFSLWSMMAFGSTAAWADCNGIRVDPSLGGERCPSYPQGAEAYARGRAAAPYDGHSDISFPDGKDHTTSQHRSTSAK